MNHSPTLLRDPPQPSAGESAQLRALIQQQPLQKLRGLSRISPPLLGLTALSPGLLLLPDWTELGLTPEEQAWTELYIALVDEFQFTLSSIYPVIGRHSSQDTVSFMHGERPDIHPGTPLKPWAMLGASLRIIRAELRGQNVMGGPLQRMPEEITLFSWTVSLPASARQQLADFGADDTEADILMVINDPSYAPEFLTGPPQHLAHWRAQRLARRVILHVGLPNIGLLAPWPVPTGEQTLDRPLQLNWADLSQRARLMHRQPWHHTGSAGHPPHGPITYPPIPALGAADRRGHELSEAGLILTSLFLSPGRLKNLLNTSPKARVTLLELLNRLGHPPAPWLIRVTRLRRLLRAAART